MSRMADGISLIAAAVVVAAVAWALLHYSGNWFFPVATLVALVALLADNRRLRKRLRDLGDDPRLRK
ncbi:hypothetical protein CFB40_27345 [Burkholderia sp. AU31652]|uniref:hypothetical protein n=1 Tax=Burkholderia TaxID=32008 RepID=UPI000B7ABC39|nr:MULTISPECIES: hypothetical protein [Burkholderia]OXI84724.1 hypothetical protein CFB40_27345 [Burkholderia sp. AU31652]OXJ09413.1 hypothetical protein CFB45_20520 [Burkholderia sp. HI2500]VWD45328.1 hypothetical protein BLA50215_05698 [Burkholderia lata]